MKGPELEENAYLAAIVGSSNDAIISKDLTGTSIVQHRGRAHVRLLCRGDRRQVDHRLVPSERQDEEMEVLRRLRVGTYRTLQGGPATKDGRRIEVSLTVSPRCDVGRGDRRLKDRPGHHGPGARAGAQLAAIIESTDDAIISKDLNGSVRSFNAAAERCSVTRGRDRRQVDHDPDPDGTQDEETEILAPSPSRRTCRSLRNGPCREGRALGSTSRSPSRRCGTPRARSSARRRSRGTSPNASEPPRLSPNSRNGFASRSTASGMPSSPSDRDGRVTFLNHEAERLTGWPSRKRGTRRCDQIFRVVHEETRSPSRIPARVLRTRRCGRIFPTTRP